MVASAFLNWAGSELKPYSLYCANHVWATLRLLQRRQGDSKFRQALHRVEVGVRREQTNPVEDLSLVSCLVNPVKRLCHYPLLLGSVLRGMKEGEEGYEPIRRACEAVADLSFNVNSVVNEAEKQIALLEVHEMIEGCWPELVSKRGRELIQDVSSISLVRWPRYLVHPPDYWMNYRLTWGPRNAIRAVDALEAEDKEVDERLSERENIVPSAFWVLADESQAAYLISGRSAASLYTSLAAAAKKNKQLAEGRVSPTPLLSRVLVASKPGHRARNSPGNNEKRHEVVWALERRETHVARDSLKKLTSFQSGLCVPSEENVNAMQEITGDPEQKFGLPHLCIASWPWMLAVAAVASLARLAARLFSRDEIVPHALAIKSASYYAVHSVLFLEALKPINLAFGIIAMMMSCAKPFSALVCPAESCAFFKLMSDVVVHTIIFCAYVCEM
ncbi:MAG: hypothetical protein SGPRY_002466 [Prymnesium sp.]